MWCFCAPRPKWKDSRRIPALCITTCKSAGTLATTCGGRQLYPYLTVPSRCTSKVLASSRTAIKISQVPCTSKSYHAHQTVGCITHISLHHFTSLTVTHLRPQHAFHSWKKRCEAHCLCSISSITKRPSSCVLSYTKSNPAVSIRNPRCYITMSKLCKWSTSPARGHTSHELGR